MRALVIVMLLCPVAHAEELDPEAWRLLNSATVLTGPNAISIPAQDVGVDVLAVVVKSGKLRLDRITIVDGRSRIDRLTDDTLLDGDMDPKLVELGRSRTRITQVILDVARREGAVEVAIYGHDSGERIQQPGTEDVVATPASPDDGRWTLLGEDDVDLIDDEITVGRKKSTWKQVKVVVVGDAVKVNAVEVGLRGKKAKVQRAELAADLADGESQVIDIAGKRRGIRRVRLQYKKHRLDASTKVQVWAR